MYWQNLKKLTCTLQFCCCVYWRLEGKLNICSTKVNYCVLQLITRFSESSKSSNLGNFVCLNRHSLLHWRNHIHHFYVLLSQNPIQLYQIKLSSVLFILFRLDEKIDNLTCTTKDAFFFSTKQTHHKTNKILWSIY